MNKKIGVLVFPAGEINSVELHQALSTCVNINLYGASSIDKHGAYVFKNYINGLPLINHENFITEFNKVLDENHIDIVFPTHDTVAKYFADHLSEIHAKVIVADTKTAAVCRDKQMTYELFKEEDFCPKVYEKIAEKDLPLFIKPIEGQGGVGAKLIKTLGDIENNTDWENYIITEYLSGDEYTVDCFTDKDGKLRAILPRVRKRLLAGIAVCAQDVEVSEEIRHIANTINTKLHFRGLWWFQLKKDGNGKMKLMEVSTRCAGTMCITRARGVNLPLLSIYDALGYDVEVMENPYHIKLDRTLISRYQIDYHYDTVYFDFDDTLIIKDAVHLPAISFLYQCKNQKKKIVLITKHETDIYADLKKYCIDAGLFDEIRLLKRGESKADYIKEKNAIFIDNAHKERQDVYHKCKIPVFDVDAIEVLQDWRM